MGDRHESDNMSHFGAVLERAASSSSVSELAKFVDACKFILVII